IELAQIVRVGGVERNTCEWSIDVSAGGALTPHRFCRQEASGGREGDALVVENFGASDCFLDCSGIVGERSNCGGVRGLHVGDGGLESGNGRGVLSDCRLLDSGISFGLLCRGLGVGGGLLRLLQLRIFGREIGFQTVDLALEFLAESIDLFFDGGFGWLFCVLLFSWGRWGIAGVSICTNETGCQNCSGNHFHLDFHWASFSSQIRLFRADACAGRRPLIDHGTCAEDEAMWRSNCDARKRRWTGKSASTDLAISSLRLISQWQS